MKTKIYNKYLYKSEQDFEGAIAVLIAFFLGFALGIYAMRLEFKNNEEYRKSLEQKYTIVVEE